MNVLLITFSFPPAGGVGVLRALSFAKYLPENGVRVDVLTARNAPAVGKDMSLLKQVPTGVTVHRTWTLDLPFALRKGVKKLLSGRGGTRSGTSTPSSTPATAPKVAATKPSRETGNPLKRIVANLLLPDPQVGWLPFAFPAARRIIRRRKIDVVLITVPPFSTVALATRLRRVFPSLPIVVDFRDEWLTTTINLVSFNKNERARAIAYKAEAEAVRDATAVVAVTEAARREISDRYPAEDPGKFLCVPNGFDTTPAVRPPAAPVGPDRKVTLTYIGSVYGSTDPATFIQAVLGLPTSVRDRLHIRYIGHIETAAYREALQSLGANIELKGFVPQAEALRAIEDTTYLLLITHDRINVAAKFYDYLGGGKPILAAIHPDGDVRRLLEETRAGKWADVGNVPAIQRMITEAVTQAELGQTAQPDLDRIASYHRRALALRYAALLSGLVAGQETPR